MEIGLKHKDDEHAQALQSIINNLETLDESRPLLDDREIGMINLQRQFSRVARNQNQGSQTKVKMQMRTRRGREH